MLWIETASGSVKATYTSQSSGDIVIAARLSQALNDALIMERMAQQGISQADVDVLLKEVSIDTSNLTSRARK